MRLTDSRFAKRNHRHRAAYCAAKHPTRCLFTHYSRIYHFVVCWSGRSLQMTRFALSAIRGNKAIRKSAWLIRFGEQTMNRKAHFAMKPEADSLFIRRQPAPASDSSACLNRWRVKMATPERVEVWLSISVWRARSPLVVIVSFSDSGKIDL